MPGGYDNLKRLLELAKTQFVVMIKYDEEEWGNWQELLQPSSSYFDGFQMHHWLLYNDKIDLLYQH